MRNVSQHKTTADSATGNARRPIVDAENLVGDRDHPIFERRFFEIRDAVQARRDPIAGIEHVARDLGLDGVDVVHQRRRTDDAAQKNGGGDRQDDQFVTAAVAGILYICLGPGRRPDVPNVSSRGTEPGAPISDNRG